jgi:hypothetical protein
MKSQIDRAMRRPWRYWYEDGLAEMGAGAIFVVLGLCFYAQTLPLPQPLLLLVSMFGPLIAMIGVGKLADWAVKRLKARLTYPRTGYVAYRRERGGRRWLQRAALGAATGALVGALAALPALREWVPAATGTIIGAAFLYGGYRLELARFYLLAAVSIVIGTLVALSGLGDLWGGAVYFGSLGLATAISGGLALYNYCRATRPLAEGEGYAE